MEFERIPALYFILSIKSAGSLYGSFLFLGFSWEFGTFLSRLKLYFSLADFTPEFAEKKREAIS
jgi:hypothetical protein